MSVVIPSPEQFCSDSVIRFAAATEVDVANLVLGPILKELDVYSAAMKVEIDFMLSDKASAKTEEVVNQLAEFYENLYLAAEVRGASNGVLRKINDFIESGMTSIVHAFSGYFDDELREFRTFVSLLKTRRNEAIWCEVFTFYFRLSYLETAPPDMARDFIKRFWECFLIAQNRSKEEREPHYSARLSKIFHDNVFGQHGDERRTYRNPAFANLFERYSLQLAQEPPKEFADKIKVWLMVPNLG